MLSLMVGVRLRRCAGQVLYLNAIFLYRVTVLKALFLIVTIFVISIQSAHAQPGSLDPTFAPTGTGLNSGVRALVVQADGKVLVGGTFTDYNGMARNRVARLNANGTLDATFTQTGTGLNNDVYALAVQVDGKVLVGGGFTDYNGTVRRYVVRLNADGTLDATFAETGTGLNSDVRSLTVQADGKVLVGGTFTDYNGTVRNCVARLNADGTLDATFAQAGTGLNSWVLSLAVQADGKILVGGMFTNYNGTARNNIARLNADGTLDATFTQTGAGLSSWVFALAVQADGKVLVGGGFTAYNGMQRNRIARLSASGTLDLTFAQTGTGLNLQINALAVQADGKVLVGGRFTSYNGTQRNRVARLNNDGTLDLTFAETGVGLNFDLDALAVQSDGKVVVGGTFTSYNGAQRNWIARLNITPIPTINSANSTVASPGATIVIIGSGFTGATAVSIGGISVASFTINSDNQITVVAGSGSPSTGGTQQLLITTPAGIASLGGFSIGATAQSGGIIPPSSTPAPQTAVVGGITPSTIGFGTPIMLSGSGFTGATGLLIGGIPVTNFVVVNDGLITAVVGGVPVNDRVTLTGGAGATLDMSGLGLTYNRLPSPVITSVAPASVVATGNDVSMTLSGINILAGTRAQVSDGASGQSLAVQSVSASSVVVTLPGGAQTLGTKTITLTNPDGQTATANFTVTPGAAVRLAAESLMISTTASGRAFSVRLSGANIFRTAQAFVNNLAARVTVPSSTQAIIEVPASFNDAGGVTLAA